MKNKYSQFAGSSLQIFVSHEPFALDCGRVLPSLTVAYHTYGTRRADNVRWVCHALTASSDVADWWPGTVCRNGLLDPERYFTVCANMLGSCYGSSSPLTEPDFPMITFGDIARAHQLLAKHLAIDKIDLLIGGSTGGSQVFEWAYLEPTRFSRLVLLATLPRTTAWIQASSAAQRMAIQASGFSHSGLAAARATAMLQYRGSKAYNLTQSDLGEKLTDYKVDSYQRYQGQKLASRFDVQCYLHLLATLDSLDVGRARGGVAAALSAITTPATVIAVSSDIMYPPQDIRDMAALLPHGEFHLINSDFGHDGFLVETDQITQLVRTNTKSK
ncbi:MAG: alpha/beta fold hydrolase [Mucinivorans sp.]